MRIDHVHFYVEDANQWKNWFIEVMGFQSIATGKNEQTHTEIVRSGTAEKPIIFILSAPLVQASPVAKFLQKHPPGVADVAFTVDNLDSIISRVVTFGGIIKQPIRQKTFAQGMIKWSQVVSNVGLIHTLIERHGNTPLYPEDWIREMPPNSGSNSYFSAIDHLVLNVASGQLKSAINWYKNILGFQEKQTFKIETPRSGLYSQVLVHPASNVQFPVNEPLSQNSQIQEFIDLNRGPGIQHIALKTSQIISVIRQLRSRKLSFLRVPYTYYQALIQQQLNTLFSEKEWQGIVEQNILLDCETTQSLKLPQITSSFPLLLQIFTDPIFCQPTFFFEIIERRQQAQGFGEGNFRALFEAIEREQMKRGTLINC